MLFDGMAIIEEAQIIHCKGLLLNGQIISGCVFKVRGIKNSETRERNY